MKKEKYIVADYYKNFVCKCGDCRACCCSGWTVTISYLEYCKLLGIPCSKALRKKLDCAFYVLKNPTNDRYAGIEPNWRGDCPLHDNDGYCMLQKELGADCLPEICKMYPRNLKYGILKEGACANSCEKVLELLFADNKRLSFEELETDGSEVGLIKPEISDFCKKIQTETIEIVCDRSLCIEDRIKKLGKHLSSYDKGEIPKLTSDILWTLCDTLENYSPSFGDISIESRKYLNENEDITAKNWDDIGFTHFKEILPDWEIYLEKILTNHLFFIHFPYATDGETLWDEYIAFCGIFILTKVLSVGYMSNKNSIDDFVDCIAKLFRFFEHSDANRIIDSVLKTNLFKRV